MPNTAIVVSFLVAFCLTVTADSNTTTTTPTDEENIPPVHLGYLFCHDRAFSYQLPDVDAFHIALGDGFASYSVLEAFHVGENGNRSECSSNRYRVGGIDAGSEVVIGFNQLECGVTAFEDTYSAQVYMTVLRSPPPPGKIIRRTCRVEIACRGLFQFNIALLEKCHSGEPPPLDPETVLGNMTDIFDVPLSVVARQEIRTEFGESLDVLVHVITVLLPNEFQSRYAILGSRCWATADADPLSLPNYEFIAVQGCDAVGPNEAGQIRNGTHKITYEVAEFWFQIQQEQVDTKDPTYFFHCDVNVCRKGDDERPARCTESCMSSRMASPMRSHLTHRTAV